LESKTISVYNQHQGRLSLSSIQGTGKSSTGLSGGD